MVTQIFRQPTSNLQAFVEFGATNFLTMGALYGNNFMPCLVPTSVTILSRIGIQLGVLTVSDLVRRLRQGNTLSHALQGQAAVVTDVAAKAADFVGATGVAAASRRATRALERGRGVVGAYNAAVNPPRAAAPRVPTPLQLGIQFLELAQAELAERRAN